MKREELVIKVCGMRESANIQEVEALGIDWLGLIFWSKSGRYVSQRPDYLPRNAKRVGVFVDEAPEKIISICHQYRLDYIQLHGQESKSYINQLHNMIANQGNDILPPQLIKAFNIATASDLELTKDYDELVDYYLFDTRKPSKEVGGRIKAFHHPRCIGIDLNSRFELSPGLKDSQRLKTFLQMIN